MNRKNNKLKAKFIRETFNDERKIKCPVTAEELRIDEDIYHSGDLFKTENGDFIDLEFQEKDFDEEELVKYVELAEDIYEKHQKNVSIYIICPDDINVCVREITIKSEADFTIKIAKVDKNPAEEYINMIKNKIRDGKMINQEEIDMLEMTPLMYNRKERHAIRVEIFKIMNRLI